MGKIKKKKNNGLIAVGAFSTVNALLLLIPLLYLVIMMFSTITPKVAPTVVSIVLFFSLSHIIVLAIFMLSSLAMAIGGFLRNNIVTIVGAVLYAINFIIARTLDKMADVMYSADYIRFSKNIFEAIALLFRGMDLRMMFYKDASIAGAIFIFIGILLADIVLLVRATKAQGKTIKIILIILAVFTTFILFVSSISDIVTLNFYNGQGIIDGRSSYMSMAFNTLRLIFSTQVMNKFDGIKFIRLEPLLFIIKDIHIFITFAIVAISSALSIPTSKSE